MERQARPGHGQGQSQWGQRAGSGWRAALRAGRHLPTRTCQGPGGAHPPPQMTAGAVTWAGLLAKGFALLLPRTSEHMLGRCDC